MQIFAFSAALDIPISTSAPIQAHSYADICFAQMEQLWLQKWITQRQAPKEIFGINWDQEIQKAFPLAAGYSIFFVSFVF